MQAIVSNELTVLCELLTRQMQKPHTGSPLAENWIIVSHRDTGRWLQKHLTSALGGLANTRFLTVSQALLEMCPHDPEVDLTNELFWSIATRWHAAHPDLSADDSVPQCVLLAEIFNAYLSERPDWLLAWERGQVVPACGPHWQADFWRQVAAQLSDQPHHRLLELATGQRPVNMDTVARVFVFAPDRLSESAWSIFQRCQLSQPVTMLLHSPSPEAWFLDRAPELELNHSLLADLGAEKARLLRQLSAEQITDGYCDPLAGRSDALSQLKHALFINTTAPASIEPDASLQFVAATSPTQEVEALKSWLMRYLNANPLSSLAEVTVVSPNPGLYGPLVQRLFNDLDTQYHLPTAMDPLIAQSLHDACLTLLFEARRSGFRANRVLRFLAIDAVKDSFSLTDRDIRRIEGWLIAAGARRGLDGHKHSLKAAKSRLLRGLLIDTPVHIEAEATPTESLEQSTRLDAVLAVLEAIEAVLAIPETLEAEHAVEQLTQCLQILSLGQLKTLDCPPIPTFAAQQTIDFRLLMAAIEMRQHAGLSRPVAVNDQLSVTSPQTIRMMPWSVVAILGADDGTFPSERGVHAWNLIQQHPRSGDLIPADAERQALLDIVLNTESHLWISWQGEHPISLKHELPGAGVSALLSALQSDPAGQSRWITKLPTGLSMVPAVEQDPIRMTVNSTPRSVWTRNDLLQSVQDPAGAFLRAKGAALRSPPDDQLAQEPLQLSPLDKYRLKAQFLDSGRAESIAAWVKHHPEFPADLDASIADGFTPENIRLAKAMQGPEFPFTALELGCCQITLTGLPMPSVPRITTDDKPNRHRTLSALVDALLCFAVDPDCEAIDLVTFDNKIHRIAPMPQADAKQLLNRWCDALSHANDTPCPLIAPLAIQHAEALHADPDQVIDWHWSAPPLLHKPHYRRLFAHDPEVKQKHLQLVRELVIPLIQLRVGAPRNAF